ncbi:hypothetical protein [Treponema sp.]|uniref:hypothetical protein n=1 Tax=Treponema sp. TaxID=166 RepID=UPI003FD7F812
MKKRLLSLILVLALVFSFSLSAFATDTGIDIIDDPLSYYFENQMLGVQKGTGVTLVCPKCDYKVVYTGGTLVTCPHDGEALVLSDLAGVHAEKVPSGIGRKDLPGYGDEGKANVNSSGKEILWVEPFGIGDYSSSGFKSSAPTSLIAANDGSGSGTEFLAINYCAAVYYFTAPVSGLYYIGSAGSPYDFGSFYYFYLNHWGRISFFEDYKQPFAFSTTLKKSQSAYFCYYYYFDSVRSRPYKFHLNNIPIFVEPLGDSSITTTNNITINNNTWNGNIYTDNSTNLTYIYPQYTTVNEKNETVTNISNTPIIYNNETKQYYTYDQTTKNYYYITYNAPSPSPTPAPTEKPGGSISTPESGKPGGDTGDTTGILAVLVEIRNNMIQGFLDIKAAFVAGFAELSANFTLAIENLTLNIQNFFFKGMSGSPVDPNIPGGGSISTPETGGSDSNSGSGWSWNPLKWLTDLLKDIVEGIIKTIWKLIASLFGFLLWLLSLVGKLFPFIPGQAALAVTSAVVIVAVIRIIKFILGR